MPAPVQGLRPYTLVEGRPPLKLPLYRDIPRNHLIAIGKRLIYVSQMFFDNPTGRWSNAFHLRVGFLKRVNNHTTNQVQITLDSFDKENPEMLVLYVCSGVLGADMICKTVISSVADC